MASPARRPVPRPIASSTLRKTKSPRPAAGRPTRPTKATAGTRILVVGSTPAQRLRLAREIAGDLGRELHPLDLAGVASKYIGETEKNLSRLLAEAERAGSLLFFDEADALFGKRSGVKDAHDRYANIDRDQLLTRLERARGVVIVATASKRDLDPGLLRRLRFDLNVEPSTSAPRRASAGSTPRRSPARKSGRRR